jgi:hypothetical protein
MKPVPAAQRSGKPSGKQANIDGATPSISAPMPASPATAKPVQEESQEPAVLPVIALLCAVALLIFGFLIWKRRGDMAEIPIPDTSEETDNPEPQANMSNRPEPSFIEDLKRSEELLKAGFVANQSRTAHPEMMKEKEVVIVLPKEAFRYEEDK